MEEKVLKALKELGFKLEIVEGIGYTFQYEGNRYLYAPSIMGEELLNICIPNVCNLQENKEPFDLCHLVNKLNYTLNYVKAYILEERLWLAYECNADSCEKSLPNVIGTMISYLDYSFNYTRDLLEKGYPDIEDTSGDEEEQQENGKEEAYSSNEDFKDLSSPLTIEKRETVENNSARHSFISNITDIWKKIRN